MSNDPLRTPPARRRATPKPRKSRKLLWILLIPASVFGLLVMFIGAGFLFVYSGQEQPVTATDRDVIVDIDLLAEWMDDYTPDKQGEIIAKTRYIDGSYDVDYEYDIPDDLNAPYPALRTGSGKGV